LEEPAHGVPNEHGIIYNERDERSLAFCGQDIPRATLTNCYGRAKDKGL